MCCELSLARKCENPRARSSWLLAQPRGETLQTEKPNFQVVIKSAASEACPIAWGARGGCASSRLDKRLKAQLFGLQTLRGGCTSSRLIHGYPKKSENMYDLFVFVKSLGLCWVQQHPKEKSRHPTANSRHPRNKSKHPTDNSKLLSDKSRHQTPKSVKKNTKLPFLYSDSVGCTAYCLSGVLACLHGIAHVHHMLKPAPICIRTC